MQRRPPSAPLPPFVDKGTGEKSLGAYEGDAALVALGLLLLGLEPVLEGGGGVASLGGGVLALDLDGHALILLQVAGEVGLLGGGGGLGHGKGLDLALGVGLLDGGDLVGLELLQVQLLDEVGYARAALACVSLGWRCVGGQGGRKKIACSRRIHHPLGAVVEKNNI